MADSFTVKSQTEGLMLTTDGRTEPAMSITFEVEPAGVTSTIQVPLAEYTAANVEKLLTERADTINAVHAL
jgi:hypothetical protein